ncbi:hypothetical protein M9Y10_007939 [Tritrichomonas musculus]|uniref:DUF3447 domain-containing protein n=1 Tax=Tritrichomonas musculus TaxID=1915356 RepID=A0ABR2J2S1_9EUKA
MNLQQYLDEMKTIQCNILDFIDDEINKEENFQNIQIIFEDENICCTLNKLKLVLRMIANISNDHHRELNFFDKIEKIIILLTENIKKYFSNSDIFNIFKINKKILLFLIEEKMIIIDDHIAKKILTTEKFIEQNYPQYFVPEIKPFVNEKWFPNDIRDFIKKDLPDNYDNLRKKGENESYICTLIREDLVTEFIAHINRNDISLRSTIETSIYETNHFLIEKKNISFIEYSVYSGSIQIFQYLLREGVELTPSLWLCAVHGKNAEIIHILEENHIEPEDKNYKDCINESIKCHHNDIVTYIKNNLSTQEEEEIDFKNNFKENIVYLCFRYNNFSFFPQEIENIYILFYACKFDYLEIAKFLMDSGKFDINTKIILNVYFFLIQLIIM